MNMLEAHAKDIANLPADWKWYRLECFPKGANVKVLYVEVEGAVCHATISKGERKGETNWRKLDPTTKRTVVVPMHEHDSWLLSWEKKNGKCHDCTGSGKTVASCGVSGTTYRECWRCNGNGLPPISFVPK